MLLDKLIIRRLSVCQVVKNVLLKLLSQQNPGRHSKGSLSWFLADRAPRAAPPTVSVLSLCIMLEIQIKKGRNFATKHLRNVSCGMPRFWQVEQSSNYRIL